MYDATEAEISAPNMQDLTSELMNVLAKNRTSIKLPGAPIDAVDKFIYLMENPKHNERLRKTEKGYKWPYAVKMKQLLTQFLNESSGLQNLIVQAREKNVYWRGDQLESFKGVIEQTEKMREMGVKKYKANAIAGMKRFIRRM